VRMARLSAGAFSNASHIVPDCGQPEIWTGPQKTSSEIPPCVARLLKSLPMEVDPRPGKLSALRRACGVGDSTRIVRTARETRLLDGLFLAGRSVETGRLRGRRIQLPVFRDDSTGLPSQPWMLPERKPP
jgi:hypothetical protein